MEQKTVYQYFKRTIPANETAEINASGKFLTMLASDGSEYIRVSIGGQPEQEFPEGLSIELSEKEPFKKLVFRNNEGVAVEIEFALSFGKIHDSRLNLSGSVFENMLDELQGDSVAEGYDRVAVGAAATLIVAANANRKSVIVQHSLSTGVGTICLGYDNTVTTSKHFIELAPGEPWSSDDYRGAIYAVRSAGATNAQYGEV